MYRIYTEGEEKHIFKILMAKCSECGEPIYLSKWRAWILKRASKKMMHIDLNPSEDVKWVCYDCWNKIPNKKVYYKSVEQCDEYD